LGFRWLENVDFDGCWYCVTFYRGALVAAGFISGLQFAVEEVLLFGILVLVKYRIPRIFDRFIQNAREFPWPLLNSP